MDIQRRLFSTFPDDVRIKVNATVHLPSTSSVTSCTLSITASTSSPPKTSTPKPESKLKPINSRMSNSFNGGGILKPLESNCYRIQPQQFIEDLPSSNVPVYSCPWIYQVGYIPEKDLAKLQEARRTLQGCSWYYEGLSWQQSENLLKDAPVGRWLIRDSSDSRLVFFEIYYTSNKALKNIKCYKIFIIKKVETISWKFIRMYCN